MDCACKLDGERKMDFCTKNHNDWFFQISVAVIMLRKL